MSFFRLLVHFFTAVLLTFLLASLAHSINVQNALIEVGADIPTSTRIISALNDAFGLLPGYAPVIAVAMLLGWGFAGLLRKYRVKTPDWSYAITGALAMWVMHLAMYPLLNVTLIAGARGATGIALQCVAGFVGGLMFAYLRRKSSERNLFRDQY